MPEVKVMDNETIDRALRRFKKECEKQGLMQELKKREYYDKPSIRKKKKQIAALRKKQKRRFTPRFEA
jgi:small subunit ribosomal protein S21